MVSTSMLVSNPIFTDSSNFDSSTFKHHEDGCILEPAALAHARVGG